MHLRNEKILKEKVMPKKILILSDQPKWVVNRNIDRLIQHIPCVFLKEYYTIIPSESILGLSDGCDMVHYGNWDISRHLPILEQIKKPFLISIRSHKYLSAIPNLQEIIQKNNWFVHVISKELLKEFPSAVYIPNGIDSQFFQSREFTVGFSGIPSDYKGYNMIKQACKELDITFKPATGNIAYKEMINYYKSINLLVCASENEGHPNPVFECMALNVPVITTDVGAAKELNIPKIERSVEGIKEGILKFYTCPQVESYTWKNAANKMHEYYEHILSTKNNV